MRIPSRTFTRAAFGLYTALLVLAAAPAGAVLPLSDTPLFLTVSVPPNITVTLDDSGSMKRAWVPEICDDSGSDILGCTELNVRYAKSSGYNLIYYNPNVVYPAAKKADGNYLTTSFTAAYRNGFDTAFGTVDLSRNYRPTASLDLNGSASEAYMPHNSSDFKCGGNTPRVCQYKNSSGGFTNIATACVGNNDADRLKSCTGTLSGNGNGGTSPMPVPAYYYVYDKTLNSVCNAAVPAIKNNACYALKYVTSTSGPGASDERQNFANWYSFARTRNLATATAASLGFADLAPTARVAWQALNSCRGDNGLVDNDCDGWKNNFTNISNAIKPFTGQHKIDFYSWLSQLPTEGSTPLPQAMKRAGDYYSTSGEGSPYDNDLTHGNSGEYACRRNYHIMMTDGIWNSGVTVGNQDGSTKTLPDTARDVDPNISQYAPIAPYKDDYENTLADVAFRYWSSDLRPNLIQNLASLYNDRVGNTTEQYWNPRNDPATWQHMVNYTIGLGLSGYLSQTTPALDWEGNTYAGSYKDLVAGTLAWPHAGSSGTAANVADLWHAAINSRGQFFSADNPAALSAAFQSVLTAIAGDAGSSAALSTNSTSIQPGLTMVYQAKFNRDWSGALLALPVDANGIVGSQIWDASKLIPSADARKIFTFDGTAGAEFSACSNLSAAQQTALSTDSSGVLDGLCADRLKWLRGSAEKEQRNNGPFRNRPSTVMGDVINSDPGYVKNLDYGYKRLAATVPGQSSYEDYLKQSATRMPMVYVGSNDGRVYGIRADQGDAQSGVEQFSYIPAGVYDNLSRLTDVAYSHRYYADGAITVGDAYLGGWKSVLVAGLNSGGKSVYALDVTDPAHFDKSKVMWEFTGAHAGLTFSQPQIGILKNGEWVAVFGNGYNSTDGGAYLYVVDLQKGTLLKEIKARDDTGDEGNGLSTPLLYDSDGDMLIDTVYAGDLQGNMWKFDLSDAASSNWGVALGGNPLFTARNRHGEVQSITAQPKASGHPLGGSMVLFGTGRYLTGADVFDMTEQTFYGIWDHDAAITTTDRSELQAQLITQQAAAFGRDVRSITNNQVDYNGLQRGWYMDLLDPPNPPGTAIGERVVSAPLVKAGRVIFVTVIPSVDPCVPGGTSWLMEADFVNGSTFPESILDLNDDKRFDLLDKVNDQVVTGVRTRSLGISKPPVLLESLDPDQPFFSKVLTGLSGGFGTERNKDSGRPPPVPGTVTRRSWIQIR